MNAISDTGLLRPRRPTAAKMWIIRRGVAEGCCDCLGHITPVSYPRSALSMLNELLIISPCLIHIDVGAVGAGYRETFLEKIFMSSS
ncbi:Uncharacterized protein HZ326_18039 [Fusarium oxysporum f. sp. albedinis]|nr:Uncharacterized protein HZ326_18039 [Fusarium oxysporum f. sp. albedinis]